MIVIHAPKRFVAAPGKFMLPSSTRVSRCGVLGPHDKISYNGNPRPNCPACLRIRQERNAAARGSIAHLVK